MTLYGKLSNADGLVDWPTIEAYQRVSGVEVPPIIIDMMFAISSGRNSSEEAEA